MDSVEAAIVLVSAMIEKGLLVKSDFPSAENYAEVAAEAYKIVLNATKRSRPGD